MSTNQNQPEQTKKPQIPQLCPVWSADFRALQTEHTNLSTEAQTQLATTLSQPNRAKEKFSALQPIAKKLESLAEKLESTYQKMSYATIPLEVLALKEALEKDHQAEIAKWQWYPKTRKEADGTITNLGPILQQDPETGRYFYEGEYDGTAETGGKGENFTDQKFAMPTLEEAMKMMTAEQAKLYREMEKAGEMPKLQLVPIALEIRTLGRAIDSRREEININMIDTYVWDEIKDAELKYEPESFKASADGNKLITTGGMSKSEYIKKHQGWVVEIIATKPELIATKPGKNAQKTEAFMSEAISEGFRGCTYESAISAYMAALQKTPPETLDARTYTISPDSSLTDGDFISAADWVANRVNLNRDRADDDNDDLRFRRLVRLKS